MLSTLFMYPDLDVFFCYQNECGSLLHRSGTVWTYITDYVDNVGRLIVSVLLLAPVQNSRE